MKEPKGNSEPHAGSAARDQRQERLKRALRENLKRRKSQAKERSGFAAASSRSEISGSDDLPCEGDDGPGK